MSNRGMTGMGFSAAALVAGAIIQFAVTVHGHGFNVHTVGVILMIAGAIGFVVSSILFFATRGPEPIASRSMSRDTVDSQGNTTQVREEQH